MLYSAFEWDAEVGLGKVQSIFKVDTTNPDAIEFLTDGAAPTISPDRTQISFLKQVGSSRTAWLMDFDGTDSRPFISYPACASFTRPAWNESASHVALFCTDAHRNQVQAVYIFTRDGDFYRRLPIAGTPNELSSPTWVGDDALIFGQRVGDENWSGLWMFASIDSGSQAIRLTSQDDAGADTNPDWSPERGSLLFLRRDRGASAGAIWTCEPDGGGRQWGDEESFVAPTWSPDGADLAFLTKNGEGDQRLAWTSFGAEDQESWVLLPEDPTVAAGRPPLDSSGREYDPALGSPLAPAWGSR